MNKKPLSSFISIHRARKEGIKLGQTKNSEHAAEGRLRRRLRQRKAPSAIVRRLDLIPRHSDQAHLNRNPL